MSSDLPRPAEPGTSTSEEPGKSTSLSRWTLRLGIVGYLVVGFFPYSVSGLVVPPAGLVGLMACWAIGLVAVIMLGRDRPIVAPAAVVGALVFWFAYVSAGSALFGWTA